ncbi:MAG: PIG-L family deacetylase [Verrucomicrobiales bacterium]|nr:PIG-L family deacetylase [Verrucomicrobiales bacterium]
MSKTILALGAHYDDCPFGISGTLLKAVRANQRVVMLSLIGDYSNWPPVQGREAALLEKSRQMAAERGMEMRFLNYASMGYEPTLEIKRQVAEVVREVRPDTAFMLWRQDRHPDHEAASAICHAALFQPARLTGDNNARSPSKVFWYDNGPGHTIDFTPDTYVDVSEEWAGVEEWLGGLMAFVRNRPLDVQRDAAMETKTVLARYRGLACGAKYAEAFRSVRPLKQEAL